MSKISGGTTFERDQAMVFRFENQFDVTSDDYRTGAYQGAQSLHDIRAFVERFYEIILGRDADPSGSNNWTDRLYTGVRSGADVARGFIGKTAIHPCQVPIIHQALKVSRDAVEMAQAILDVRAGAVFQIRGVMCEPETHRGWARRTMARARTWGVVDEVTALQASKEDREVAIAI